MTVLPIVERELRVAARRAGTCWLRLTAGFVAIAVFGWMLLTLLRDDVPSAAHGRYLFRARLCLLPVHRRVADGRLPERREA